MEAGSGFGVQPGGFGVIGWRGEVPDIGRRVRIVTVIPNPGEKPCHLLCWWLTCLFD